MAEQTNSTLKYSSDRSGALQATKDFKPGTIGYGVHKGIYLLYHGKIPEIIGTTFPFWPFETGGYRARNSAEIGAFFQRPNIQELMQKSITDTKSNLIVAQEEVKYWELVLNNPSSSDYDKAAARLALKFTPEDRAQLQEYFANGKDRDAIDFINKKLGWSGTLDAFGNALYNIHEWFTSECFTAETPILMSDGTYKPITEIKIGDEVMAFEGLGELQPRKVTQTFITPNRKVVQLGDIKVTLAHHFLQHDGSFKTLEEIDTNAFLVGITGKLIPHPGIQPIEGEHTVYNFTVEGLHTYIAGDYRVHNLSYVDLRNKAIVGNQIGEIFGSSLGQAIAGDNVFAQIGSQTVLSTVLGNVGQFLDIYLDPIDPKVNLSVAVKAGFDDFSEDLFKNLKSTSTNAISSFLTAELSEALDIPGDFGGQLLKSSIGNVTSTVVGNVVDYVAKGAKAPLDPFNGLDTNIVTNLSSFVGGYLARQVISPKTTAGAIGGSIGGAIGSTIAGLTAVKSFIGGIGSNIASALGLSAATSNFLGSLGNLILPGIGALVGTLVGTLLGDWINERWGDEARAWASLELDSTNGKFYLSHTWRKEGGNKRFAIEMAQASRDTLNSYLDIIGGVHIATSNLYHRYGHREKKLYVNFRDELHGNKEIKRSTPEGIIDLGVIDTLKRLRLAGGDVLMKRVIEKTQSKTIKELNGDLQIAQDYVRYLENKDVIDLMIASAPNSAFAAGWVITLIRAEEIGITDWSKSDFYGGLAVFFESLGLEKTGASLDNLNITVEGTTLKLEVIIDGNVVHSIEITDIENKIGYKHLSANATGATVNGTAGNDIWLAENVASTFIDSDVANDGESNDILVGGSGNDSINAGLGWDFVRGNGGNDLIVGGAGNDALYGGDGDDIIYGDENAGFAAIPADIEISDGAADNAKSVSDITRQTWFSSATHPQLVFYNDEIHGGAGSDSIAGGEGDDHLFGDAGNDKLYGDAGNDRLEGGNGADIIYGGAGYDAVSYANATAGVTVDLAGGTFKGTASDGDQLYSIEDIIGSAFGDTLKGDAFANIIDGGAGADTIDGRTGRDAVSFFSSTYGVEINLNTGIAVTKIGETTTETDTLLNIEDAIGSAYDDTLIGSPLGGGLDGDAGNDTIIIHHDDIDVANGAATYDVRGGEGVDNLSFANWDKSRGVQINLNGSKNGHSFSSIEKAIGSTLADSITGSAKAEIFDGGKGDDVFNISQGGDVYLLNRGSNNDQLRQIVVQTDVNQTSNHGTIKVNNDFYRQLYPGLKKRKVELKVNYKDSVSYGVLPNEDEKISQQQSIVFGEDITYHDIFGNLTAINPNTINLAYEKYFTNGYPSNSKIITKQELIDLLSSIDLTIGIKPENAYITNSQAIQSQLTDTITIQGGGILPDQDSKNLSWVGFSEEGYSKKRHKKIFKDDTFTVTHQGTQYNFGVNQPIERLGFADSGHIELGQIKYFKDGSADVDTLVADTDKATWLYGGNADDVIKGSKKADVLIGGKSNDFLQGNDGDDQYAYWLGDGYDIIDDQVGIDTIVFGGGITLNDIKLKVGKLDDSTNYKSFREILPNEVSPDLKIEIYNPQTTALTGSITVIDFQDLANFKDKLRFAGDYEVSIFELLEKSGDKRLPTLTGTTGDDTLTGSEADEAFWGLAGNNTMRGNEGDDIFYAHGGADNIDGDDGSDTLDYRYATDAVIINLSTEIVAESTNFTDKFNAIENAVGSDFDDTIIGNDGDNILVGRAGNDVINSDKGNDRLFGDSGDDLIQGDRGDDLLNGGAGNDTLTGGGGRDRFSFTQPNHRIDTITDFTVADDLIEISASGFDNNLAFGQLDISQFTLGNQASTNAQRLIYNHTNGDLLFDSDGSGTISAIRLAKLNPNLALTHQHFVVV
ncbi:hypothetical protein [Nostoc sp. CHAB 5715]|uniref:hypothetical protein n=1 Tax=Nostoc sp. CHAB 5715 TaxID=2780400 RepID=UPI001E2D29B1|nr:hypothetical protein [Nostoc sp. CHAB 5715]MCC5622304.1 hypothetical protein [Nostoc sp. CHAB 5715]